MTSREQLSKIVGFEVPVQEEFTQNFGREIIDFSIFVDLYRELYPRNGQKIYEDIETRFGREPIDILNELT